MKEEKKIQFYTCQNCGYKFKIKRGRQLLTLNELDKYLLKAQCFKCGRKLCQGFLKTDI